MKVADTVEGSTTPVTTKNTEAKKRTSKLDLSKSEIQDMVKIKRLEKSGGTKPSLDIKEDNLKKALDDGTVEFNTRDRAVLNQILKP
jgi:hypothetical protein